VPHGDVLTLVRTLVSAAASAHDRCAAGNLGSVVAAATAISEALRRNATILAFGNGGSAGDAQHFAAELVGRFEHERPGLPAIALTADTSILTAIANDYGYDVVFERQVKALGKRGDVALGISTSGRSRNVELGLVAARDRGLTTIALTGRDGGPVGQAADIHVNVAEASSARVQEVHRTLLHALCAAVDEIMNRTESAAEHRPAGG
jgi:D-sedoheptulose 7-phosphate isomerase